MKKQAYSSHVNVMMWYIYKYTRGTLHYYRYSDEKYKALTPHEENMNIKKLKKEKRNTMTPFFAWPSLPRRSMRPTIKCSKWLRQQK